MAKAMLANGKSFEVVPQTSILEAALAAGVVLPYSCGTGRCGTCKARVVAGQTVALRPEPSLGPREEVAGYILTCCRTAATDVTLDVEDLGGLAAVPRRVLPCRIDAIDQLASDVVSVRLRVPPGEHLHYLPGQYINVIGCNGHRRSYSIANAPTEDGKILLFIKCIDEGLLSQYWFTDAKVNDLLRLEGPCGTFYLRETRGATIVFLATGTGIAPVKALLEEMASKAAQYAQKRIVLYWGVRSETDLYWRPDFSTLQVEFVPVLSRPLCGWVAAHGYVQEVLAKSDIDFKDAVIYACGSEQMINDAVVIAEERGLAAGKFLSDAFVSSTDLG